MNKKGVAIGADAIYGFSFSFCQCLLQMLEYLLVQGDALNPRKSSTENRRSIGPPVETYFLTPEAEACIRHLEKQVKVSLEEHSGRRTYEGIDIRNYLTFVNKFMRLFEEAREYVNAKNIT